MANQNSEMIEKIAHLMASSDLFARHLGIELLELQPGFSRAALKLSPYMVNGLGLPHGAVIFALADFAFAAACNSHGRAAVAQSMDIHFLASPKPNTRLTAEAEELHLGKSTGLYRIWVTDDQGQLIAELHGMAFRKGKQLLRSPDV
jgi:acyl-CoA thioesterase